MTQCTICRSNMPGYLIEFDSEESRFVVEGLIAGEPPESWSKRDLQTLWLSARLVTRFGDYWTAHMNPCDWAFRAADRGPAGVGAPSRPMLWNELSSTLPLFWIDDIIAAGTIGMAFQPLVEVTDSVRLIGYEMLSRASDAFGSPIPPVALFEAAREQDRLFALDKECRIQAVRAAAAAGSDALIFVNFIPTSIYNPSHCLRTTMSAANDAGIDPSRIVFEVVETDRVADTQHLVGIFDYYRRNGARCALDDCGAGFNSVETILALEPDVVKLDRSLCDGVSRDRSRRRGAAAVVEAAGRVGAIALAEGIETEADAVCLRDMGYAWQQGFLYGRPSERPQAPLVDSIARSVRLAA